MTNWWKRMELILWCRLLVRSRLLDQMHELFILFMSNWWCGKYLNKNLRRYFHILIITTCGNMIRRFPLHVKRETMFGITCVNGVGIPATMSAYSIVFFTKGTWAIRFAFKLLGIHNIYNWSRFSRLSKIALSLMLQHHRKILAHRWKRI